MFHAFRRLLLPALAVCAIGSACSKSTSRLDAAMQQSAALAVPAGCTGSALSPSALPPDQGVWMDNDSTDPGRVVAMIGPTDVRAGSTAVTRTIETIEGVGQSQPIRARADAAVMHVELLPRQWIDGRGAPSGKPPPGATTEPAAAYTLTPLISLVSYEACVGPPAVRYLRRDAAGKVVHDAMLHRTPDSR